MTLLDIDERLRKLGKNIQLVSIDAYESALKEITKKLNKKYYGTGSEVAHAYIVGSVGRGTAAVGESDVDMIFELPWKEYERFSVYADNGQSALLQEVKEEILGRYPRTDLKGDGQVVVIDFDLFRVELVPAFLRPDGSYLHPDTNHGGSWKSTYPRLEQRAVWEMQERSLRYFGFLCNVLRVWRGAQKVAIGGFLIDTLVYDYFSQGMRIFEPNKTYFFVLLKDVLEYIARQDENNIEWQALGSGVPIGSPDNGSFIRKAKKFAEKTDDVKFDAEKLNEVLSAMLGSEYENADSQYSSRPVAPNEEFIEDESVVALNSLMSLDCRVTQDGFRPFPLRKWLSEVARNLRFLSLNKSLEFHIEESSTDKPYGIKWKVRNVGEEAVRRNDERGSIFPGSDRHVENTKFTGPHYVECYIEKEGVCVSRTRLDVPIDAKSKDDEHVL